MPEGAIDIEDLKLDTLSGDIADVLMGRIRTMKRPWSMLAEAEQRDLVMATEQAARDLVRKVVTMVASYEWPHAVVRIGEVKIKGEKGIETKIASENIEHNRNVLGDAVGDYAMLLMVDSETFMAARAPQKVDPDQPALPV